VNERGKGANVEPDNERRARLERYLLGTLDETDRQQVREEAIVNPDVHAELREIEIDLLDAAARGTLDADRLKLVQERLLAGDRNREAWTLAQALAAKSLRADGSPTEREPVRLAGAVLSTPEVWSARHRRAAIRFVWLSAAVIVGALSVASYVSWRASTRFGNADSSGPASASGSLSRQKPADIPLPPLVPAPPIVDNAPGEPPAREPAAAPSPSLPLPPSSSPQPDARAPELVAVYFPAATLRGAKPVVRVGSSARVVQIAFEIDLPTATAVGVSIRAVPGAAVLWSAGDAPVRRREGAHVATIRVPASLLPPGSYEAAVSAAGQTGAERVFPFVVRRE
jgi:hypothetical protein